MDKVVYKAVTPNLLVSIDGKILIEKNQDGPHYIVGYHHWMLKEAKYRLFKTEAEASDFISYLTSDEF